MIGKTLRKIIQQLLLVFSMLRKKKVYPAYISKHNSNHEKQAILLMISNGEGWHYKNTISIIKRNSIKKHYSDFY